MDFVDWKFYWQNIIVVLMFKEDNKGRPVRRSEKVEVLMATIGSPRLNSNYITLVLYTPLGIFVIRMI